MIASVSDMRMSNERTAARGRDERRAGAKR
jgi:hypothetical protein